MKDPGEEIRPDEMVKLWVVSFGPSVAYPSPGEKVSLDIGIRNVGQVAAKKVDLLIAEDGKEIHKHQVDIEVGETLSVKVPWRPTEGTHALALRLDPAQHLTQTERSGDNAFAEVIVAPKTPSGAEIVVTVDVSETAGHPAVANVSLQNAGSRAAGGPLEIRSDDTKVAAVLVKPIPAGGTVKLQIPLPLGTDTDVVTAEFDPGDRSTLKNPEKGIQVKDSRVARDLRVEGLSLAATPPVAGKQRQATVSFRIVNHGKDGATEPFQTSIFPGQLSADRRSLAPYMLTTKELAAGKTMYVSRTITLPDDVHEFDVRVETDAGNKSKSDAARSTATVHFKNPAADVGRWVTIGPNHVAEGSGAVGVLFSIALDPSNPATFYVGSHGSGVWKSADGGASWNPITDSFPTLKIAALGVDPSNTARVYVATPTAGIYRSEDGGTSWTMISESTPLNLSDCCNNFIFDPANSSSIYLSSFQGVFHSTDGGASWTQSLSGGIVISMVLDKPGNRIFASLENDGDLTKTGIYALNLTGTTWNRISGCIIAGTGLPAATAPTRITLSMSASTLYAAFRTPTTFQLFRTTGGGCRLGGHVDMEFEARWNPTGTSLGDSTVPSLLWNSIYSDPTDANFVYATGTYFWRSIDGGMTFRVPDGGPHADDHGFAATAIPGAGNISYIVCDGGIYFSTEHGADQTWQFMGTGITNVEFYDIALAATDPNLVIGGTQDNGTEKYDASSLGWAWIQGGDGGTVAIDPTNSQNMYAMFQYASSITASSDGGASFNGIGTGLPDGAVCFNIPFEVHPKIPTTLLASCTSLWRTPLPGTTWSSIFAPANESVTLSSVDPTVDLYYAGTNIGNIYAGTSGTNFQRVFTQPSGYNVTDIQVDPTNPTLVYVAFGAGQAGRVFLLKRNSAARSSMAGVDITSNLPLGLSVGTLAVDPEFAFTVYAGTNAGVFRGQSFDSGATWFWTSYNNGLPPAVIINRLTFHPTSGVLRAGTFGRSAFEVNTDSPFGGLVEVQGKIVLLRVNDVGTGYGPPTDFMDVEAEVWLDTQPGRAFGFTLRKDTEEADHLGMLKLLRDAFNENRTVQLDLIRTGVRNGRILRVMDLPE